MEPSSQEQPQYFNQNNHPYLVIPQDLAMRQNNDSQINGYPQGNAVPIYSVNGSQEPTYNNNNIMQGQHLTHLMEIDPALTDQQPGTTQQKESHPQATERMPANTSSHLPNAASTSQLKPPPIIIHQGDSSNGSGKLSANTKASDLNSSKPSGLFTDEVSQALASIIAGHLGKTAQSREQIELDIRSIIKNNGPNLLDSNKARKRSHGDSPGLSSPMSEQGRIKCTYCHKMKKTQCDLKYTSLTYSIGSHIPPLSTSNYWLIM